MNTCLGWARQERLEGSRPSSERGLEEASALLRARRNISVCPRAAAAAFPDGSASVPRELAEPAQAAHDRVMRATLTNVPVHDLLKKQICRVRNYRHSLHRLQPYILIDKSVAC